MVQCALQHRTFEKPRLKSCKDLRRKLNKCSRSGKVNGTFGLLVSHPVYSVLSLCLYRSNRTPLNVQCTNCQLNESIINHFLMRWVIFFIAIFVYRMKQIEMVIEPDCIAIACNKISIYSIGHYYHLHL